MITRGPLTFDTTRGHPSRPLSCCTKRKATSGVPTAFDRECPTVSQYWSYEYSWGGRPTHVTHWRHWTWIGERSRL